jgi:RNA 3'-terminal phosphate cyclase (ATP)
VLRIDGSARSGSGTIVRTAVAVAALSRRELHLVNIRAARKPPGLQPQHLRAVQAVAELTGGRVEGAGVGSSTISFYPGGPARGGEYAWDIGTAGSTVLVAMTVLPLTLFASGPTRIRLTGGLFQDFAPPAYHMQHVLLPLLGRMGARAAVEIVRPGYPPKGGGVIELMTHPCVRPMRALSLGEQGTVTRVWGTAISSHLADRDVSERMAERARRDLQRAGLKADIDARYDATALQPGAALAVFAETDTGARIGADQAGAPRRPSEAIGRDVARMLLEDLRTGATVDRHFADQAVLYAALADGATDYVVPAVTDHVDTNLWLVDQMLGARTQLEDRRVRIEGIAFAPPG